MFFFNNSNFLLESNKHKYYRNDTVLRLDIDLNQVDIPIS